MKDSEKKIDQPGSPVHPKAGAAKTSQGPAEAAAGQGPPRQAGVPAEPGPGRYGPQAGLGKDRMETDPESGLARPGLERAGSGAAVSGGHSAAAAGRASRPDLLFGCDGYDGEMRVLTVDGQEAISEQFAFSIQLACRDGEIDFEAMVGTKAHLELAYGDETRVINGLICRFEQGVATDRFTPYYVELVPRTWLLTQRFCSRIFQEKDVVQIVKDVLEAAGLKAKDFRFALQQSYQTRTYCVQYRETDWNFISRLLEEEGIYYFFEHKDGVDTLVMGDAPDAHADIVGTATVLFRQAADMVEVEEYVFDMRYSQQVRPGKVAVKDFNFTTPTLSLLKDKSESSPSSGEGNLEVYDYPALFDADGPGTSLAKKRLESIQASRRETHGQSVCRRLAAGSMFTLQDFPRRDFNGRYLITFVRHTAQQPVGEDEAGGRFIYNNTFRAIPAAIPFRPARVAPKPLIEGAQTAIVTGPGGEEIYTDKYARVKVQFHWDREGKKDEKTSCWIRVAQLWAGESWGAMYIPRIGQEVIVDFLEGDPDRPIITGRVYNAKNMPPYALDGEKTRSTIKSNSSKGGGGFNEYRFEDKKGSEEIYQHGQKDLTIVTENDKNQSTGHDETLKIGHDRAKDVGNNETTKIGVDRTEEVGSNEKITIGSNRTESVGKDEKITIAANRTEDVGADESISITGNRTEKVGGNEAVEIGGNRDHKIGGNDALKVSGDQAQEIGGGTDIKISGSLGMSVGSGSTMEVTGAMAQKISETFNCEAKDSVVISSDKDISIKCGDSEIILKKDGTIFVKGKDIKIDGSGKLDIKAAKDMIMKAKKILQN